MVENVGRMQTHGCFLFVSKNHRRLLVISSANAVAVSSSVAAGRPISPYNYNVAVAVSSANAVAVSSANAVAVLGGPVV